jgi:hypothetical protein
MVQWTAVAAIMAVIVIFYIERRRKARDLHKVPLASGTVPLLGNFAAIKVCTT